MEIQFVKVRGHFLVREMDCFRTCTVQSMQNHFQSENFKSPSKSKDMSNLNELESVFRLFT